MTFAHVRAALSDIEGLTFSEPPVTIEFIPR
jgi:hypothetical protein